MGELTWPTDLSHLSGKTLALILSCGALALLVVVVAVVVVVWTRRRRRKPFDLHHLDDTTEPVTVQSAPGSRSPSPKLPKRLSCPDALQHAKRSVLVRSLTVDKIPDFTLPPERIQPRASGERGSRGGHGNGNGNGNGVNGGGAGCGGSSTAFQYQQSLIGSLQPDLYSHSSSFSEDEDNYLPMSTYGRLWYSLVYDSAVEQLNVTLIKVKDLPGRGSHHHPRDPFVKVFLLPDDRTCRTSKVRKKTLSPIFNENFVFQVTSDDIKNRVVRFSVYDVDRKKVRHSLGHVMVPLRDVDLGHVDTYWSDLESMPQALSSLGDLELSLCYLPQTEKIKVGIMRARNLKHTDMDIDTRLYLRLQLFYGRKMHRTKRTSYRPGSLDMTVNESVSFSVSGKQLDSCRLEIALMMTSQRRAGMLTHDVEYGRVVIGPFMYARGEELIHWQEIMAQPRSVVTRWHSLTASPSHD
ncbi:synaptotagmin-15-like isoform X2 [Babylonia areolata]|uniref:synaptotagmin-15-like isoform X2 n=1 Tax=Babylonia areolata TaxID=304850 RepID=UPI003FD65977